MYVPKVLMAQPVQAEQLLTSAANIFWATFAMPVKVRRIGITITTATSSSASIVLTVYVRNAKGSATNQVTVGTITVPTGIAAGKKYVLECTPTLINEGQSLEVDVTTQSTSAGKGVLDFQLDPSPEVDANLSNVTVVTS